MGHGEVLEFDDSTSDSDIRDAIKTKWKPGDDYVARAAAANDVSAVKATPQYRNVVEQAEKDTANDPDVATAGKPTIGQRAMQFGLDTGLGLLQVDPTAGVRNAMMGLLPQSVTAPIEKAKQFANTPIIGLQDRLGLTPQTIADAVDVISEFGPENPPADAADLEERLGSLQSRKPSLPEKIMGGAQQAVIGGVESLETPTNLAALGGGAFLKGAIGKALTTYFTAEMIKALPEEAKLFVEGWREGDPEKVAKAMVGAGINAAFIKHAVSHLRAADPALQAESKSPETKGTQDALPDETPAEVHADVSSPAIEGEAQVPVKEGGEGIQSPEEAKGESVSTTEGILKLPEVKEGMVRLYTGKGGPAGAGQTGTWYSQDINRAASFGPDVSYVDVPTDVSEIAQERARNLGSGTKGDHALSGEWTKQAKPVGQIEPPVYELDASEAETKAAPVPASEGVLKKQPEIDRILSLPDDEMVKYAQGTPRFQGAGVKAGLSLTEADVPALEKLRDEQHKLGMAELNKLLDQGKSSSPGMLATQSKVIWLNGVIEGAKKKGGNYEAVIAGEMDAPTEKSVITPVTESKSEPSLPTVAGENKGLFVAQKGLGPTAHWIVGDEKTGRIVGSFGSKSLAEEHMQSLLGNRVIDVDPSSSSPGLGITPFPGATAAIKTIGQKLTALRTKLVNSWATRGNKADIAQQKDAADNQAKIYGNMQGRSVNLEANRLFPGRAPEALRAVIAVIESGGDRTKLAQFIQQSTGKHFEAMKAAQFADANWTRLQPLADKIKALHDAQIADENANGIATTYRENYIKHAFDVDKLPGRGSEFFGSGGGIGSRSGFKAERKFETIYDAIEAGYGDAIKSLNAAKLTESRLTAGQQLINDRQWVNAFRRVADPSTGKPIIESVTFDRNHFPVAPPGYEVATPLPGQFYAVHQGYKGIFEAVTDPSKIGQGEVAGLPVGKAILTTAAGIKHGLLLFDTFHASRIMQKEFFLTGKVGYRKGLTLLDYNDADLSEAVRQGEITQSMADYARTNRPKAILLTRAGLNVGRIQEALRSEFLRNIPVVGTFNRWVFDKLTRGAMMQAAIIELDRTVSHNPGLTPKEVAAQVARKINVTFGNIGRQGLLKSRTMQDISRLAALAPQWVESMARSEIGGIGELAKVPVDLAMGRGLQVGTLGRAMAGGLLSYLVGTQLLNLATRGHLTMQNEEEGHKLDAWIPDVTGKTKGFFLNPLSVVAELTHDAYRYAFKKDDAIDVGVEILKNKASPFARAAGTLWNGKNYQGEKITGTWNRIEAAGQALVPTPILFSGAQSDRPGQMQRQLTASLGVKTEPAESTAQSIYTKAQRFMDEHKYKRNPAPEPTDAPSYSKIRQAIRNGDDKAAMKIIETLRENVPDAQIEKAMKHFVGLPFTRSSRAHEKEFMDTLNERDAALYEEARAEQQAELERFKSLWAQRP
jgi:hypothetical protein